MDAESVYHLYIDDSGQREYAKPGQGYDLRLSRHFVFGGTLLSVAEARRLSEEIAALKLAVFGSPAVEVKSVWLRRADHRARRYLEPFGVSEAELRQFVEDFYDLAGAADLSLIASVVDKVLMTSEYGERRWHTPAAAYEAIVQRLQNQFVGGPSKVKVFIDRLPGKTPARNFYESNLRAHHKQLIDYGSRPINLQITCLHGLPKFIDSADSHLVQISDVVAYNVLRQVRDHENQWEAHVEEHDMYPWFRRILGKFRSGPGGQVQGYGVVPFPKP